MGQWFKDRLNSLIDNLLWLLLVAVVIAVGASIWAWGSEEAHLPIWAVVLFGAVQAACVVAIVALFNRRSTAAPSDAALGSVEVARSSVSAELAKPPHPHAGLLDRMDAYDTSLDDLDPVSPLPWSSGQLFNALLEDANLATERQELERLSPVEMDIYSPHLAETDVNSVRAALGQMRSIVRHADSATPGSRN